MKLASLLTTTSYLAATTAFSPISPVKNLKNRLSAANISSSSSSSRLFSTMPICIVVEAEIKEDRMDDFLDMIEKNAVGSRAEPGCIRFGE